MKKYLVSILFSFFAISANADDCELLNYKLEGQWTYTQNDKEHTLEFTKGDKYIIFDGEQKEYSSCYYFKSLNKKFSVSLKKDFKMLSFNLPKDESDTDTLEMEMGWDKFNLTKKQPVAEQQPESNSGESSAFTWTPEIGFDNHLFPSLIIATATWSNAEGQKYFKKEVKGIEYLGDLNSPVEITLKNIEPESKIKVEVDLGSISKLGVWEGVISNPNKTYVIKPRLSFDYQALLDIKQPKPIDVRISLYVNDEKVGEKNQIVTVRSINDVPLFSRDEKGALQNDYGFLMAAFVNENNPNIDLLLREAINTGVVDSFSGHQSGTSEVYRQVFAIWNVLQRRGMKYSSITTPTGDSKRVSSQYVRFFDDTIETSQANCIDGTVLFASILRKIGINSKIVMIPSHAFLGFSLDEDGKNYAFLETTAMGNVNINQYNDKKRLRDIFFEKKTKNEVSQNSFIDAVEQGNKKFKSSLSGFSTNKLGYKMVDVAAARRMGILPINK